MNEHAPCCASRHLDVCDCRGRALPGAGRSVSYQVESDAAKLIGRYRANARHAPTREIRERWEQRARELAERTGR
jgi:hypothetical protein